MDELSKLVRTYRLTAGLAERLRLMGQCGASPLTIANYRDAFCLVIAFAQRTLKKSPAKLSVEDLDAPFITRFLDYLERERGNSPRSRNVRLAAIHSFFNYVALREPTASAVAQRVLAIRSKRCAKNPVDFLTRAESEAVLAAQDQVTWSGRRDRTLLLVALQTGLRVSELIGIRCQDVFLESGAHVRCIGKGRKSRCIPLRKEVVKALRQWLKERDGQPIEAVFINARHQPLSRDGVQYTRQQCASQVPVAGHETCLAARSAPLCRSPDYAAPCFQTNKNGAKTRFLRFVTRHSLQLLRGSQAWPLSRRTIPLLDSPTRDRAQAHGPLQRLWAEHPS